MIALRQSSQKSPRGFTMVELLVAFVLIGTVLAALSQVQSTSVRSTRAVAEATAQVWRDQSNAAAYVHITGSNESSFADLPVTASWQDTGLLTEQEVERLAARGWQLRALTLRNENGKSIWQGATIAPFSGDEQ